MALITESLEIPPVAVLFPSTRRWRKVKGCGTAAAYRRHLRRKEPMDADCRLWHRNSMRDWRSRVSFAEVHFASNGMNELPGVPRFGADDYDAWNGGL